MSPRASLLQLAFTAMLGLSFAAFAIPILVFPDQAPEVSKEALRRLRTQAAAGVEIAWLLSPQVVDARMVGPTPYHVEGRVVWRSLFGVVVGETTVTQHQSSYRWDTGKLALVWAVFLVTETLLAGSIVWRLRTSP